MTDEYEYDEFALLAENAAEIGVKGALPRGQRVVVTLPDRTLVSAIAWGDDPQVVFLHGGGQNAHTWDTVIVALGVSALTVDLPGHGHSDWRADRDYWPLRNAGAVAPLIRTYAPNAVCVVGMSLGGLTTIRLASVDPELVGRAVIIDVTPSVFERQVSMSRAQRGTTALITGPREFDDIDEMVNAAAASAPHRSRSSIRRGVLHNARRLPHGNWAWRYDELDAAGTAPTDFSPLWRDLAATSVPIALVTGGDSVFVADTDRDEFRRRRPDAEIVTIAGAGHSVQSDQPLELARYLRSFLLDDAANDR